MLRRKFIQAIVEIAVVPVMAVKVLARFVVRKPLKYGFYWDPVKGRLDSYIDGVKQPYPKPLNAMQRAQECWEGHSPCFYGTTGKETKFLIGRNDAKT